MRRKITLRGRLVCLLWLIISFSAFVLTHSGYDSAGAEGYAEAVTEAAEDGISEENGIALNGAEIQDAAGGYIRQKMPHPMFFRVSRPSGLRLEEPSRNLYIALRERVSAVAAGEEGSTEFQIPYEEVFTNTFTADELGVSAILTEDRTITQEAKTAAMEAMLRNRSAVHPAEAIICLIYDSPYELYWFDKSEGHGAKASYVTTGYSAISTAITVNGYIQIRMSCSRDYAVMSVSETGETTYAEYEADTRYGAGVQAAAENAAAILNANEGKSDYEKMIAYKDAICAMADYNSQVSDNDPYGDPWQLVWVFDGKPNTMVVCEGYTKAFQYLCDLGTDETTVISVQGSIPAGKHMWNIVTINGLNYLADITNCDLGHQLFLKGYSDGNPETGYYVFSGKGLIQYTYNRNIMARNDCELTLSRWDYALDRNEGTATLPAGLAVIGEDAFSGTQIEVFRMTENVTEIAETAFQGMESQIVIRAPQGSTGWTYAIEKGIRYMGE